LVTNTEEDNFVEVDCDVEDFALEEAEVFLAEPLTTKTELPDFEDKPFSPLNL
jgi:hypothetical protein